VQIGLGPDVEKGDVMCGKHWNSRNVLQSSRLKGRNGVTDTLTVDLQTQTWTSSCTSAISRTSSWQVWSPICVWSLRRGMLELGYHVTLL
jgi:hypothetical protein